MINKTRSALTGINNQYFLLFCLLLITVALYYPALYSRFLLDDFYNLSDLSLIDANGIAYFVFGGFSGPSGRPVSLFSFAMQYQDWPANPFAFKLVNLVIHLLNGVLVWFICKRLVKYIISDKKFQLLFVLLTTGLWLLHPIQFSTVLYVIQRMTQISAFFVLAGVLGYLWARDKYTGSGSKRDLTLMSLIVASCTLFAILGKENGILLPLFIIVIEATLLINNDRPSAWKWWAVIFLGLPLILLAGYLVNNFGATVQSYHIRPYTLSQRLMTEASVLFVYLKDLIVPSYGAFTVHHDDFPVSTSLLSPTYTIFSVAGILILLILPMILHRRVPVFGFALLWFFAGHILTATFLNLELYYEHRNYLPSLGIFFGVSWLIIKLLKKVNSALLYSVPIIIYILFILILSTIEARLWSSPARQITEWARLHPTSVRAMEELATLHLKNNQFEQAINIYEKISEQQPDDIYPLIQKINIENCKLKKQYDKGTWETIITEAKSSDLYGLTIVAALDSLTVKVIKDECGDIDRGHLDQLLITLAENKVYSSVRSYLYEFATILKLDSSEYNQALNYIRLSLNSNPRLSGYIQEIRILKLLGRHEEAKELIREFNNKISKDPRKYLAYHSIIKSL